jgi:hypothetical protein
MRADPYLVVIEGRRIAGALGPAANEREFGLLRSGRLAP